MPQPSLVKKKIRAPEVTHLESLSHHPGDVRRGCRLARVLDVRLYRCQLVQLLESALADLILRQIM